MTDLEEEIKYLNTAIFHLAEVFNQLNAIRREEVVEVNSAISLTKDALVRYAEQMEKELAVYQRGYEAGRADALRNKEVELQQAVLEGFKEGRNR